MKKILFILLFVLGFQGIAEMIVTGEYVSKKGMYSEYIRDIQKKIKLNYELPSNNDERLTFRTKKYDIVVNKSELMEMHNKNSRDKITKLKNTISESSKTDRKYRIYNYIAVLIEDNRAVIYDRKTKEEVTTVFKVKYDKNYYYDLDRGGRGSNYEGLLFFTDNDLENFIMRTDYITNAGIHIHSSWAYNPYTNEEKINKEKFVEYNELKALYEKAVQEPNVKHTIRF